MSKVKITLLKSTNSALRKQKATVEALGLKKIRQSVIHEDNAMIQGMIFRVRHMVSVEAVAEEAAVVEVVAKEAPAVKKAAKTAAAKEAVVETPAAQKPVAKKRPAKKAAAEEASAEEG